VPVTTLEALAFQLLRRGAFRAIRLPGCPHGRVYWGVLRLTADRGVRGGRRTSRRTPGHRGAAAAVYHGSAAGSRHSGARRAAGIRLGAGMPRTAECGEFALLGALRWRRRGLDPAT